MKFHRSKLFNNKLFFFLEIAFMFFVLLASISVFKDPSKLFHYSFEKGTFLSFVESISASLLVIFTYLIIFSKLHDETLKDYGFKLNNRINIDIILGLIIGTIAAITSVFFIIFISNDKFEFQNIQYNYETIIELLELLLIAFIYAGLREEILLRGYLFRRLIQISNGKLNPVIIILISGILFGFLHFGREPLMVIITVIHGVIYGTLYFIRGYNLVSPIIAHGTYNFILFYLSFLQSMPTPLDY